MSIRSVEIKLVNSKDEGEFTPSFWIGINEILLTTGSVLLPVQDPNSIGFFGRKLRANKWLSSAEREKLYEPQEREMLDGMSKAMEHTVSWLRKRKDLLLDAEETMELAILVEIAVDNKFSKLTLPPRFLAECGKAGLKIEIAISQFQED